MFNGKTYYIKDVWTGLGLAKSNFWAWISFIWIVVPIMFLISDGIGYTDKLMADSPWFDGFDYGLLLSFVALIQSIIIYNNNCYYEIDMENGDITIPRSDVENSILEILFFVKYFNLMRVRKLNVKEVERVYLDIVKWKTKDSQGRIVHHKLFAIDIVGTFGSQKLTFTDRQKRDEVRNAINQCVKKFKGIEVDTRSQFDMIF